MPNTTLIALTTWRNQNKPFGIKDSDRLGHIYCLGKTGSGKSTLLLNMAISDIQRGNGLGVIDPHGELAEEIINHIPPERAKDVVYFNAGDTDYPIAFNPLQTLEDSNRYLVAATLVTTLKKLWADSWGPRLEHILRNTLISLSYYSKSTLLDIVPMLTNYEFRKKVLYAVPATAILEFWQKEFEPLSPQLKNEFIAPIVNKVGLFSVHPILKNILGQSFSKLNIAELMDNKAIFIANLSKGSLGESATTLLGSLLVTQFQVASLARETRPINKRVPFYLYIDEVHSFMTKSFADILSESRKYGLSLFLTHQFIEQLLEDIYTAIIGNVGTLISFRIGARDAAILEQEFSPVFSREDLIALPRYSIYIKLLIDNSTSRPFSAYTLPVSAQKNNLKEEIITYSRQRYCTRKFEVEKLLAENSQRQIESKGKLF